VLLGQATLWPGIGSAARHGELPFTFPGLYTGALRGGVVVRNRQGSQVTGEAAEQSLDHQAILAEFALDETWERWYWYDTERILLEAADLSLPVLLKPDGIGIGTFATVADVLPLSLRAWDYTEKLYLAAHYHGDFEEHPARYFIDVATPEREIAELFTQAKGGGKIRTREEILAEPWPCTGCSVPLSGRPNMTDALEAWDRGDDEIQHFLTRRLAEATDPAERARRGRAKPVRGSLDLAR
jgi:hypothetical protein